MLGIWIISVHCKIIVCSVKVLGYEALYFKEEDGIDCKLLLDFIKITQSVYKTSNAKFVYALSLV